MTTIILSTVGALWASGVVFVASNLMKAPEGHEDERGFHFSHASRGHAIALRPRRSRKGFKAVRGAA